ncbi:MAG: sulfotransferase domain-containing protein, partial [Planctomycetota bacterium]
MRLPDFLIIGAAKAGTTSLYHDLRRNPLIFMPREKEAGDLRTDDVLTPRGGGAYARLFAATGPDQVCGEAPTDYTKLPQFPGVPRRALAVIGPRVKAIYLVREPVARIISYHHHKHVEGVMPGDINVAVRECPELLEHTRYAMQITPWIETLGSEQVRIVRFEDYIADRPSTVAALSRFLGIEPRPDLVRASTVYNPGTGKPVLRGPFVYLR